MIRPTRRKFDKNDTIYVSDGITVRVVDKGRLEFTHPRFPVKLVKDKDGGGLTYIAKIDKM